MMRSENGELESSRVMWLANNNEQAYRHLKLHAPAEDEVSAIVKEELARIHRRFMYERGMNLDDAPDPHVARDWVGEQTPTKGFYDALKKLEMIFNINQIVSILSEVQTAGVVQFYTEIEDKSTYSVSIVYRSIA